MLTPQDIFFTLDAMLRFQSLVKDLNPPTPFKKGSKIPREEEF